MNSFYNNTYNPDVLSCLANLSNDEVFTPPKIANAMLDLLPQKLFENPETTFLDPACKSGVFLREIAKRLIKGLESTIPNLQKRLDHIFTKQLFGIAVTELTSLLSRRSVYCSKYPACKYSVTQFTNACGNIFYSASKTKHVWIGEKCLHCGASKKEYSDDSRSGLEKHAYQFIHNAIPEEIENMKFDVIIGNPPYQFGVGNEGGNSSKARAIYHHFVTTAMNLKPSYLIMITPSRWMTRSVEGIPDSWIDSMLNDKRIRIIHDYLDANECFPGIDLKGGVNYFLWDKNYSGNCNYYLHDGKNVSLTIGSLDQNNSGIVIRDPMAKKIIGSIEKNDNNYLKEYLHSFEQLVSPKDFFTNKLTLTSSWTGYKQQRDTEYSIKYYLNKNIHKLDFGWIKKKDISKNQDAIGLHKVYIPAAGGSGNDDVILGKPFYGEPNSVCSQTYLVIGYDKKHNLTQTQCQNIISYIKTRFFRYLVSIKKKTQNGPRGVYQFVPMQDFSKPWTDSELYKKYGLSTEEINFIESMIRPMA